MGIAFQFSNDKTRAQPPFMIDARRIADTVSLLQLASPIFPWVLFSLLRSELEFNSEYQTVLFSCDSQSTVQYSALQYTLFNSYGPP